MIIIYLKYLPIIFCGTYAFIRIFNLSIAHSTKLYVLLLTYIFLLPLGVCFSRKYVAFLSLFFMVAISVIIHKISCATYDIPINRIITATITGYGISYVTYAVSSLLVSVAFIFFTDLSYSIAFSIAVGCVQFLFTFLLFRLKRLKHGITFFGDSRYDAMGIFISISLLIIFSFLGIQQDSSLMSVALVPTIFSCGVALWLWWHGRMTQEYMEQLRKRERQDLENVISGLNEEISQLKLENETFSKIIHKDNKLLPAMELAVKQLLYNAARNDDREVLSAQTEEMIAQLERISAERAGIVRTYEQSGKRYSPIGIPVLDALFTYMVQKADSAGIELNFSFQGDIKAMIPSAISEQDLSTVLADLIENAIIATNDNVGEKRILVSFGQEGTDCCLSVSDSAPPFSEEVMKNWGIQRITTHADTGGSGIGMMSIHNICKKYNASFSIEDLEEDALYSKRVIIRLQLERVACDNILGC